MAFTLESIEVLDAIDRKGSFAAAAQELGKVPSALTYVVRKLEEDMDLLLFDRRKHRAELTPAGRALLDEGRHLLQAAHDLTCRVKRLATGWEVELSIAVTSLLNFEALLPVVDDFYRENPGTRLRFSTEVLGGTWDALLTGRADLTIGASDERHPGQGIQSEPMGTFQFVFAVSPKHPLAQWKTPVPNSEIIKHRIVAVGDSSRNLPVRSVGILAGQDTLTVSSMRHKITAQMKGLGCGWLPEHMIQTHLAAGSLVLIETEEPRPPMPFVHAWRSNHHGKALAWWRAKLADPRLLQVLMA